MKKLKGKFLHRDSMQVFEINGSKITFMESTEPIEKTTTFMEGGVLYHRIQTRTYRFTYNNKNSDRLWLSAESRIDDFCILGMFHKQPTITKSYRVKGYNYSD